MMRQAKKWVKPLLFFLAMSILCGVLYTAFCTGIAQMTMPYQANGSIIKVDGVAYGSELVGQEFDDANHLWGRIMIPNVGTFTDSEGNPVVWYGPSNLSPASEEYQALVKQRVEDIHATDPEQGTNPIPSDLVTCSGSGFDPNISPAAAEYQVGRLAKNNHKSEDEIRQIIKQCTDKPQIGLFGDERVNVLKVNLMLDGVL